MTNPAPRTEGGGDSIGLSEKTPLSEAAQIKIRVLSAEFTGELETLARTKARRFDEVQSAHVEDAAMELRASKLDELTSLSAVIIVPIGLFILGLTIEPLLDSTTRPSAGTGRVIFALVGAAMTGFSVALHFTRPWLKRMLFTWARRGKKG